MFPISNECSPKARARHRALSALLLALCANVAACSDDSKPSESVATSGAPKPETTTPEAVSSLQSWAQQATADNAHALRGNAAPAPSSPASDALAPPVIHTVE